MKEIKINEQLKQDILSKIPEGYSNLEKAMFIYNECCLRLQYSFDYYIDENNYSDYFTDATNLEKVDGVKNKDVVCFTFNAIFAKLLVEAGICDEDWLRNNIRFQKAKPNHFSYHHDPVQPIIDGILYDVDATFGVLDNNDLLLSKYSDHKYEGWTVIGPCDKDVIYESEMDELKETLSNAIDKVQQHSRELSEHISDYIKAKNEDESYLNLPLETRVEMFKRALKNAPPYSILSLNYLLKFKHKLFSGKELGKNSNFATNVELLFAKNVSLDEYQALLLYNPQGYINDFGYEHFDALQIYILSIKDHSIRKINFREYKLMITLGKLVARYSDPLTIRTSQMTRRGRLHGNFVYDGDAPKYDEMQKLINLAGYVREHVATGTIERLTAEEYKDIEKLIALEDHEELMKLVDDSLEEYVDESMEGCEIIKSEGEIGV